MSDGSSFSFPYFLKGIAGSKIILSLLTQPHAVFYSVEHEMRIARFMVHSAYNKDRNTHQKVQMHIPSLLKSCDDFV